MPSIFQGIYGESVGIAGLNYIALGLGLSGASQINARTMDKVYVMLKKRNGGVGRPEFRLRECRSLCFSFLLSCLRLCAPFVGLGCAREREDGMLMAGLGICSVDGAGDDLSPRGPAHCGLVRADAFALDRDGHREFLASLMTAFC